MRHKELIKKCGQLSERCRVTKGGKFRLKQIDPGDTAEQKKELQAAREPLRKPGGKG